MKRLLTACLLLTVMPLFSSARALDPGDTAPAVSGTTETGETLDFADVYSKHDYTLVYFYPKADTPGCTKQGCSLRDGYEALSAQGVAVIGVSTDDVDAQKAFKEKYNFPFTLVADTDKTVMKAFGVPGLMFASRQAYLIHDGKIVYADHQGSTTKQADDILEFLAKSE